MDIERIKSANTKFIGKEIIYEKQMDSTQDEAIRIKNKTRNGTIILTDYQTKGKGTKGRTWHSCKEKNIMMTITLYPNCELKELEGFTVLMAQIMKNVIEKLYHISLEIKYPNDLLLNGKKIAGILTQSSVYKEIAKELFVGIGFNVNETNFEKEISEIATSLKREFHYDFKKEEIIIEFIEEFEKELMKRQIIKS